MQDAHPPAPALRVTAWLNTPAPIDLESLRGRVVVLHAFQMLCPGCVAHGLPQATRIHEAFADSGVTVIGLHTVFEHHDVMTLRALEVFVREYGLAFPIGVDQPAVVDSIPLTMQQFQLGGTPSIIVLDRQGRIRLNHLGRIDDLLLGALIGRLQEEVSDTTGRSG